MEIDRLAEPGDQLIPHRPCRVDADLLSDDGAQQGFDAGLAQARLGLTMGFEHLGESLFPFGQRIEACMQRLGGPDHQATLAA